MRNIFDYIVLSFILAVMFSVYAYILTTATMIILYGTIYALTERENTGEY